MNLAIVKDYKALDDLENFVISIDMLRAPATHLFIASNAWDSISIEICDEIPDGVLRNIKILSDKISVSVPEKLSDRTLRMLIELFPDKGGAIRRAYMSGSSLSGVIPLC